MTTSDPIPEPESLDHAGEGSVGRSEARAGRRSERRRSHQPGRPRSVRHVVRVHPETELQLEARAAARDISVAQLLVDSALSGGAEAAAAKAELAGELYRVTRFLGRVGVNVNQIARATNATSETQPETAAAMAAVTRVCGRLEVLLDDLERGRRSDGDPAGGEVGE